MKDRILHIMRKENMSQQDFARALEVSPATLSNIFNGKTNPTNNHVTAIHRRFPDISVNWVMFGEGEMYTSKEECTQIDENTVQGDSASLYINKVDAQSDLQSPKSLFGEPMTLRETLNSDEAPRNPEDAQIPMLREVVRYIDKPQRKITEIRIFFDDGTFEVFSR